MRVVSVSIGQIREVTWRGKTVETGIFKRPLDRRLRVGLLGIEGDEHANTAQHGGSMKALLAYPSEHYYEFWRDALRGISLSHGGFGENLTTEGWLEEQVYVADKYRVGTALVAVTIPRKPCFKLNALHRRDDVLPKYLQSGRTGFYLTVLEAGEVGAGDAIDLVERHSLAVTPGDVARLYLGQSLDRELLDRTLRIEIFTDLQRQALAGRFERFIIEHEDESKEL
jgi:MOSC domain-containing protein YiiM